MFFFTLGPNSVQSYALTGTYSNDFDVDFTAVDTPYLIVRSSLDRQRLSSYSFTLIASDHGQQPKPLSTSISLDIQILASNESIPVFAQSLYSVDVREDAPIATALLTVGAIDENDQQITYEFLTPSPFTIDRSTGQIQLNQTLDYERQQSYRLSVKAVASGIPAYAIVFVRVIDVNDNPVAIRLQIEGKKSQASLDREKTTDDVHFRKHDGRTSLHRPVHLVHPRNDARRYNTGKDHLERSGFVW